MWVWWSIKACEHKRFPYDCTWRRCCFQIWNRSPNRWNLMVTLGNIEDPVSFSRRICKRTIRELRPGNMRTALVTLAFWNMLPSVPTYIWRRKEFHSWNEKTLITNENSQIWKEQRQGTSLVSLFDCQSIYLPVCSYYRAVWLLEWLEDWQTVRRFICSRLAGKVGVSFQLQRNERAREQKWSAEWLAS